jgi:hypothetical protein
MDREHKGSVNNKFQIGLLTFYDFEHGTTEITYQVKN